METRTVSVQIPYTFIRDPHEIPVLIDCQVSYTEEWYGADADGRRGELRRNWDDFQRVGLWYDHSNSEVDQRYLVVDIGGWSRDEKEEIFELAIEKAEREMG